MAYFDYKVVPAPRRIRKTKGVSAPEELFALTLTEAINEHSRQGWEYVRAETLAAETPGGWFRRGAVEERAVLVFRRERSDLGPRLAAEASPAPHPQLTSEGHAPAEHVRRPAASEAQPLRRREPVMGEVQPPAPAGQAPLRAVPTLGPAERP